MRAPRKQDRSTPDRSSPHRTTRSITATRIATVGAWLGAMTACAPHGSARGAAFAGAAPPPSSPTQFAPTWRWPAGTVQGAVAPHAMVVSNSALASDAGVEILRAGGNAVDAAVAVGFALAVTHPEAGNIGGGGYMVIRLADGRTAAIDYRETAPAAATRDMFVGADGHVTDASIVGPLASGVPGAVAGLTMALDAYGSLPLRTVMAPAIRLAGEGFIVDSGFHHSIAAAAPLIARFGGASRFLPGGVAPPVGVRFVQPELAATLTRIAEQGRDGFYHGPVADALVDEMRRDGGLITADDLAHYRARRRRALTGTYRGYTITAMPPSSSGGITVLETLNILGTYDSLPPFGSAAAAHLLADAFQRAFIDRNDLLGDPDFVSVPVARLTSPAYARSVRATIAADHATPTPLVTKALDEGRQTTHYSIVDAAGNAVATTTTLNNLYGSGVYVAGAGFFLNDEMDDFAAQPGAPNMFGLVQGDRNAIAPGKRMLSSMSPTIVVDASGAPFLVVGGRGGSRIISSTAQVIIDVIDYHMSLADAMAAPRLHHQGLPDSLRVEAGGFAPATLDSLRAMGYALARGGASGTCTGIMRTGAGWTGVVDPRTTGGASGY
jgi:gamma-glutamyltranspeptidase/glutathione hydrolase